MNNTAFLGNHPLIKNTCNYTVGVCNNKITQQAYLTITHKEELYNMSFKSINRCQPILFPFNPCNSVTWELGEGVLGLVFTGKGYTPS